MVLLKTVRAKLTALVALSGLVLLAALPIIFLALQKQLIEQADDRLEVAEKSFRAELSDGIKNLKIAAQILATDSDTATAILAHNAEPLKQAADIYRKVYEPPVNPGDPPIGITLDVLFADAKGAILTSVGCDSPPATMSELEGLGGVFEGHTMLGVTRHGCEHPATNPPPAYTIAMPVFRAGTKEVVGAVVLCLPVDARYLENAGAKLDLSVAILPADTHEIVQKTSKFPGVAIPDKLDTPVIADADGKTWVVIHFEPRQMRAPHVEKGEAKQSFTMAATIDVSDIRTIVRENLLKVIAVLIGAAAISLFIGWRLASVMSRALRRVNAALKKVEQLEYVHVEAVRTGDELEDLASGFNTMVDGLKERDNLRNTFGKYMTASVMDHLLSGKVQLGGVSIPVTILFTDIRSFTTISEKMDAQALVGLLNEYFSEMVGIVMTEEGVVDKYIGDAMMAVFGAPVPKKDDAIHAVRAAVRMREALAHLNERLKERGLTPLRTGIGIHTGEVVAGNIGSERRMEYTVIGDAVNLASRLESSTKDLGVNILISEDTYNLTKEHVEVRPMKEITVKGRVQPVMTFEVLGLKGEQLLPVSESSQMRRAEAVGREARAGAAPVSEGE